MRKMQVRNVLIVVFVVMVGAIVVAGIVGDSQPTSVDRTSGRPLPTVEPSEAPEPAEPVYLTPVPSSFAVELITVERTSYGEAGDLISWESEVSLNATSDLDPSKIYLVTFDVHGGEDGTETFSFEMQGDRYEVVEHTSGVAESGGELTVEVTSVRER